VKRVFSESVSRAVEWNGMVRFDGRSFITNDARFVRPAVRWQPVDAGILACRGRPGRGPVVHGQPAHGASHQRKAAAAGTHGYVNPGVDWRTQTDRQTPPR